MPPVDTVALVITPQRQKHIRHHHHQRRTLSQLLIQAKQHAERRNGDQPTANPKQTAKSAEGQSEQKVQGKIEQGHR